MNTLPEFDPFDLYAVPRVEEQPDAPNVDEEPSSLEGTVFCPFLTAADLDGTNWDADQSIPEFPLGIWEVPGPTEDDILKAITSTSQDIVPVKIAEAEKAASIQPVMDWLEPPEKIAQKLTPLGRKTPMEMNPGLYGNLADTSWLSIDRLKPLSGSAEESPDRPYLVDEPTMKSIAPVEADLSINDFPYEGPFHAEFNRPVQAETAGRPAGQREKKTGRA